MKNSFTPEEKHLTKIIIAFAAISTIVTSLVPLLFAGYGTLISIGVLLILFLIVWLGKEKIFELILTHSPALKLKSNINNGTWNIKITFNDKKSGSSKKTLQTRTGSISVTKSLIGLKIKGGKLLNTVTNKTSMNGWYADRAEVIRYQEMDVLFYIYKIPSETKRENSDGPEIEKIGFVYATRKKDSDFFEGHFRDIKVTPDTSSPIREGQIVLTFNGKEG